MYEKNAKSFIGVADCGDGRNNGRCVDRVRYALKDGEATVVRQALNIQEARIAKKIAYDGQEYAVTRIEDFAFSDCDILEFVLIPDSVTDVAPSAFRWSYGHSCPTEIFCEAESMPDGWSESWCDSYSYFSVYWKSNWAYDENGNSVVLG